jgi:hypothetical protein
VRSFSALPCSSCLTAPPSGYYFRVNCPGSRRPWQIPRQWPRVFDGAATPDDNIEVCLSTSVQANGSVSADHVRHHFRCALLFTAGTQGVCHEASIHRPEGGHVRRRHPHPRCRVRAEPDRPVSRGHQQRGLCPGWWLKIVSRFFGPLGKGSSLEGPFPFWIA